MEVLVRAYGQGRAPADLVVVLDAHHRIADVAHAIAVGLGLPPSPPSTLTLVRTGLALDPEAPAQSVGLLSGDELLVGEVDSAPVEPIPIRAVTLDVLAGTDAGLDVILPPGTFRIGRQADMEVVLTDVTVDMHQFDVTVDGRFTTTVSPVDGTENPTLVNGRPITAPTVVTSTDLVEDGPHALIGGTSGAGKSELLQSIVGSLASRHSPRRLNFLFVDYKGGASSAVFNDLPHTVGYVTNLSAELSLLALTSLRAELNRRMRDMEGRAKDLTEMGALHPDLASPSLVIIVDEFATLVKEVPEFVAGIVDIAQRGRSLGIHLILATQRPSGSVNDNILANTNLRISLRMLDKAESNAVINSPEAADIPVPLKGRAFARLGPRRLVAFQSAFCGAPMTGANTHSAVLVGSVHQRQPQPPGRRSGLGTHPS